ncbi:MAG TPA: Rieske 2Fe-2S domain-containing protein [Aggregatilinea sp.]|uniref:Rieske 2Fe-2S domain-containing protein n=1 Tax=Aggregatilinea sp. TaxID=2806333 RepID=UPI002C97AA4E|nr:Rieske 2Fe-2S domain-containing protein [Aggregatilinea sp.]HML24989.1 Rieske 2Fe-2S domain-containing protein [Aggregatilinea sp.]
MADSLDRGLKRRTLLRLGGCAAVMAATGSIGAVVATQTDLVDRLQGVSDTKLLAHEVWDYEDGMLTVDLSQVPDLAALNSAMRIEDEAVPEPLLIVHGADDDYYIFVNRCPHNQRQVDPVEGKLKCVCPSHSTFDYTGAVLSGPAGAPLGTYTVAREGDRLQVALA